LNKGFRFESNPKRIKEKKAYKFLWLKIEAHRQQGTLKWFFFRERKEG